MFLPPSVAALLFVNFLLPPLKEIFTQVDFDDGPSSGRLVSLPDCPFVLKVPPPSSLEKAEQQGDEVEKSPFPIKINPQRLVQNLVVSSSTKLFAPPPRPIQVWLPPGYNHHRNKDKRYPVLYCHDGQNACRDDSSWTGHSWRLTGALASLYLTEQIEMCPIVVLIPSSSDDMIPWMVRRRHVEFENNWFGQAYIDTIVHTVKPAVDAQFRTYTDAKHTASIGSSLGGQIAFLSALRHPNVFGGAAALSPCFTTSFVTQLVTASLTSSTNLHEKKWYIDNGGDVEDTRVPLLDPLDHAFPNLNPGYFWLDTMLQPGIDAVRHIFNVQKIPYQYQRFPGARHNERAWAKRIHQPLLHFYQKENNNHDDHDHNNNIAKK